MRICLLGASLNTGNMGVSALASGTVTSARSMYPDAEVFLLDYGREPSTHTVQVPGGAVTVELVNIRFSKKIFLRNNIAWLLLVAVLARLIPVTSWRQALLRKNPWLRRLLEADIIASIAGGDSFSDIYGLPRLLYVGLPQILVLQLGRPLILLPQTLGPFKGWWARRIARYIMRGAQMVYSRDQTSFDEAGRLLGPERGKLKFSHDMAFLLEPKPPTAERLAQLPARDGRTPLVGLNVSGLLLMGGYSRDNMFGLKVDYHQLVRAVVEHFVKEHGANVVLVPHVFGEDGESDTVACARVYEELQAQCGGRLYLLRGDYNQHEIKYLIGQCDFFLGSRMHACIAALSQAVPAACLSYSRKFVGVMGSIGCAELAVDLSGLDVAGTMAAVRKIYGERADIRARLQQKLPEVRNGVSKLFDPAKFSSGPASRA